MAGKKLPALAAVLALPKGKAGAEPTDDEELGAESDEDEGEDEDFGADDIETMRECMESLKGDDPAAALRSLKAVFDVLRAGT